MNNEIELQISAIFLDGSKRVLRNESDLLLLEQIPNSRMRVNRNDSAVVMNSMDGVIVLFGTISSAITICQAALNLFKKFSKSHKWETKPELIIQVKDEKGNCVHVVINRENESDENFEMNFRDDIEIKLFHRNSKR